MTRERCVIAAHRSFRVEQPRAIFVAWTNSLSP
jgi:hypothetical protein